jgi:Icc-related predicted phosphoesterase
MIRIAVVTDIHHHATHGKSALHSLADFVAWANTEKPDIVLDLGDRITDVDKQTDMRLQREVAEIFAELDAPVQHLCGNHDRDNLSVGENAEILRTGLDNTVIDLGGWQLAVWRADTKFTYHETNAGFVLPEADLRWLSQMTQQADKPTLIASHIPFSGHSQIGNYYFERNAEYSTYPQSQRIRAAIAQARVPLACIAGHVHRNTVTTIDGIPHLTQQSLTECFTTGGEPAHAWGFLKLGSKLEWQVFGNDPFELRLTPSRKRSPAPLAPFVFEQRA